MPPQMPHTPPLTPPQMLSTSPATSPSTPKKTYLTMDNLFAMFTGKPRPLGLQHRSKNPPSPPRWRISKPSTSQQARIISYFLPTSSIFKSKKSKRLDSNRQSSSAAEKLIDVGRFGLKRAFPLFSILSWISRIRDHFS